MNSWKTTALGIAGALSLVLAGLVAQFDADPATVAAWLEILPAAAALLGIGVAARDNDVSSEAAGAK